MKQSKTATPPPFSQRIDILFIIGRPLITLYRLSRYFFCDKMENLITRIIVQWNLSIPTYTGKEIWCQNGQGVGLHSIKT